MTRYRITAVTHFDTATPAVAREWFEEKIDREACPFPVETIAEEDHARPHMGDDHPAALTFHNLNNAAQILYGEELEAADYARALELLEEGISQASALNSLFDRTERALEEVRASEVRLSLDNARLVEQLASAQRIIEKMEEVDARHVRQINAVRDIVAPRPLTMHGYEKPFTAPRGVDTDTAPQALRIAP